MKIFGLQKLSLLDFPGKVACTVFTGGCNLRCPFCHNASLVLSPEDEMPQEEFFGFLSKRIGKLEGVCVTGGEPLINRDIDGFLAAIKAMGFAVKLDTNGCFPEALRRIVGEGLVDYVAMDIKNSPSRYAETVGIEGFDVAPVLESADFLLSGAVEFEFRTTVVRGLHDEDSFREIARRFAGAPKYFLQSFKDSGDLISPERGFGGFSREELERLREILTRTMPDVSLRGVD